MNYTKPEIASLASASLVIQSGGAKSVIHVDNTQNLQTPAAYEADE